ncbi:hypothetical protein OIV83_000488 [Microbotryomycetes sp. JL201]|nr:hypothetical protein OIV83_000488 [Microbotryomycetes sp. JL201]
MLSLIFDPIDMSSTLISVPYGVNDVAAYQRGKQFTLDFCRRDGFEEWSLAEVPVQWNDEGTTRSQNVYVDQRRALTLILSIDPNKHVNNFVYAKYLEAGLAGFLYGMMEQIKSRDPSMPDILSKGPSPDYIAIAHRCKEVNRSRILLEFAMISLQQCKQVSSGEVLLVGFDQDSKKAAELHPSVHQFLQERTHESDRKQKNMNDHLNNAVYAKYLEAGRIAFTRGMIRQLKDAAQMRMILARVELNYETMSPFHTDAKSQRKRIASGGAVMVAFDYDKQSVGQLPKEVYEFLQQRLAASKRQQAKM